MTDTPEHPVGSGRTGTVYGLGVGPGDPELITVKALRLLRAAAVVAYPAPERGPSLARSIVAGWLDGTQREMGKVVDRGFWSGDQLVSPPARAELETMPAA